MRRQIAFILILILFGCLSALYGQDQAEIELSKDERQWIADHPLLKVANETDWPPFDFAQAAQPAGHSGDLIRLIAAQAGMAVTPEERKALAEGSSHLPDDGESLLEADLGGEQQNSKSLFAWWILPIIILVLIGLRVLSRVIDRPVTEEELENMSRARKVWMAATFSNLRITAKILIILVLVAASSVALFGYMNYQEAKRALMAESFNKLTAVREMKAQQIEDYFDTIAGQVVTFSESRTVVDAMNSLSLAFAALEGDATADHNAVMPADPEIVSYYQTEFLSRLTANTDRTKSGFKLVDFVPKDARSRHLQEQYIAENQYPTGSKQKLNKAADGSEYSTAHEIYHPIIRSFLERFGYYDIFLIDHDTGHIIYSVFKEVDYATSLLTGPYKDTNFSKAFRQAREAREGTFVILEDFEPYQPSYNAPASFIASPIFDGDKKIGVLVFQMPIAQINTIMSSHQAWKDVGLGDSGETYLVGDDYLMRNQSRFLIEDKTNYLKMIRNIGLSEQLVRQIDTLNTSIGLQPVETKGTRAALAGRTNTEIFLDYRGVSVLSSYRVIDLLNVRWAIMSEIDEDEATAAAERLKTRTLMLLILFLVAILAISFAFAKTMTRPIKVLTAKANALAEGDLGISIEINGGDEIAQLGRSFDVMRKALAKLIGGLEEKVEERTAELAEQTGRLRSIIDTAVDGIIVVDQAGLVLEFSPAAELIFGYSRSQMLGQNVLMLMPNEFRTRHSEGMANYLGGEPPKIIGKQLEVVGLRRGGDTFPLSLAVADASIGGDRLFTGIVRDISDKKTAEAQLTLQATALESAANAIVITDPQGRIQWANPAFVQLTGYELGDVVGKTPRVLKSGEHSPEFYKNMWETITTGRAWHGETTNRRKDGNLYSEEMTITPVRNNKGDIANFVAIKQDITVRKQLEKELAKANKRMSGELNVGRDIQMSMVPLVFPAYPSRDEFSINAQLLPAREVGGDFYDFFFIDDDWLFLVVGDVSDKGVPAALFMAVTKTMIKSTAMHDFSPGTVMTRVNNELCDANKAYIFVTVFAARLNVRTGEFRFTNAGHNPPCIKRGDGTIEFLKEKHGPVIGAKHGIEYKESQTTLMHNDMIMLYTDGVTEAKSETEGLYCEKRLSDLILEREYGSAAHLVDSTMKSVQKFQGKDHQADDITVLALQFMGEPSEEVIDHLDITIQNRLDDIAVVASKFESFFKRHGIPAESSRQIKIACDEIINNAISYGYTDAEAHEIEISMVLTLGRIKVVVSDDAKPFNPFSLAEADTESSITERAVGGLGIHLVRNMMNKVAYYRKDGRNIVAMIKHFK